jgi:hypothetical protein
MKVGIEGVPLVEQLLCLKSCSIQATLVSVRVRAAGCVMKHSSKAIEIENVEARVGELSAVRTQKPGGRS